MTLKCKNVKIIFKKLYQSLITIKDLQKNIEHELAEKNQLNEVTRDVFN